MLTKAQANYGYIAHIISWTPTGWRGDTVLSPKLAKDPSNLMLMCDVHHRTIDSSKNLAKYTVKLLREYKRLHEKRTETLTKIKEDKLTTLLILQAPIGPHDDPISEDDARRAVIENGRYPEDDILIVNLQGLGPRDGKRTYWQEAKRMVAEQVHAQLQSARHRRKIDHLSIFALAPIPILIQLGLEIGDKVDGDVYNLARQPKGWVWPNDGRRFTKANLSVPTTKDAAAKDVCAIVSVTSSVQHAHVSKAVPGNWPVFELRLETPNIDLIRSSDDLREFVRNFHSLMEAIHDKTPNTERIHVFTGVPVAVAVEMGRAQLPKRHAKLVLYDFNRSTNGMTKVMEFGGKAKKRGTAG